MRRVGRVCRTLLLFLLIAGLAGGSTFVGLTLAQAPDLDRVNVKPEGYLTTVLDEKGEVMVTLAGVEANRIYVDLEQIPEDLQHAFVAVEDARFYRHHGIDLRGILRAAWKGIRNGGRFTEGASTITQQLLKNNVFEGWTGEKTFSDRVTRKLQEQALAIRLEQRESKEMILENYLNTINLGAGTWGVQAAARRYFGKDVGDLSLSECAVLAGITRNPSEYDPIRNPRQCRERQELVLKAMAEQGYITAEQREEAEQDDVFRRIEENHTDVSAEVLSWFEDTLVEQVRGDLVERLGYTGDQAWDAIYRGGLTIRSTADLSLQELAEREINNSSWYDSQAQASLVLMDVDTGAVRALVGGRGEKTASLVLNRAVSSVRQPGSVIKVIGEYAAALEQDAVTLGTVLDDAPCSYANGTAVSNADGTCGGMTTVRTSIVKSLNIPAVKVFQQTGMDAVWTQLENFGIRTLTREDRVEALALGGTSGGLTNLEVTAAYNALAAGGEYHEPFFYTQVLDHDGQVLLENLPSGHRAVKASTAQLLTSAMEDVLKEGTGTRACFDGYAIAGKSGTTTGSRDVWFVGYTTELTCGVWGGFDDDRTQDSGSYVKYIWKAVMQEAASVTGAAAHFPEYTRLTTCEICRKCGGLAVEGLCDSTVQGDMTTPEYYLPGTEPTQTCSCHGAVEICGESGLPCGTWCPAGSRQRKVYLRSATPGTEDAAYVMPGSAAGTCTVHRYLWDRFGWGEDRTSPGDDRGTEDRGSGRDSWWDSFVDWIS